VKIGILALQGDYELHSNLLTKNNIESVLVKKPEQLSSIDGLIIPGGESSVILMLIDKYNFRSELINFAKCKNIFGTCAGAIIMSLETNNCDNTLGIIDIKSDRNFWGSQINSFTEKIQLKLTDDFYECHFIRAPKFTCLSENLVILSYWDDSPILLRNKKHLVSSFHPEMTDDFSVHNYFLGMINE
jgi:5'-phosphate synthase pdxT subunit